MKALLNAKINIKKEINKMADFKKKKVTMKTNETTPRIYRELIEFRMSKTCADDILRDADKTKSKQENLCNFVNTQYGLKGYCVRVLVDNK